jgi:hypothetical protein
MQQCCYPIGQHPQAQVLGRQHFSKLISLQPLNASFAGNRAINFTRPSINSKYRSLNAKCSASSTDTATKNAEWPPLQGSFTYKQLRALPVSNTFYIFG